MRSLNFDEYMDKVRGCWAGKNIGGTLGAPMEGNLNIQNVSFYTQELNGTPVPNDDLDLQLIWLAAVETHGLDNITPRLLGEYWHQCIIAPCSEYAVCNMNIANGFLPPMSGVVNNERYKYSNGAWIRSEIWACICPGAPDEAIRYAYMDSCADHAEEGIWAEIFTTALQSAAFVVDDLRELVKIALSKIPQDSQLAKAIRRTIECFDQGMDWLENRQTIMKEFDIVRYRAAVNIAFVIIGMLYGDGDFGKSICTAVNCGDDTDCTGATVGALFGILRGRKGIPERWLAPIGESINTICINRIPFFFLYGLPTTLEELSQRTARCAKAATSNPFHTTLWNGPSELSSEEREKLCDSEAASRLLTLPVCYQDWTLPYGVLRVEYKNGATKLPGESLMLNISIEDVPFVNALFTLRWRNLPNGWTSEKASINFSVRADVANGMDWDLIVGEMPEAMTYLELEIELQGRKPSQIVKIPVQQTDAFNFSYTRESNQSYRCRTRITQAKANTPCRTTPQMDG